MKNITEESEIQKSFSQLIHDATQEYIGVKNLLKKISNPESLQQESQKEEANILQILENLVILNNSYLTQGLEVLERMNRFQIENSHYRDINRELQARCEGLDKQLLESENYCEELKTTKSYRVSRALVDGFKKPGINTGMIAFKIIKIILGSWRHSFGTPRVPYR